MAPTSLPAAALVAAALALLPGAAPASTAQEDGPPTLSVATSDEYEAYLATRDGRAVYMFTEDIRGGPDGPAGSTCFDACAEVWPPLMTPAPPAAAAGVDPDKLGTIPRGGRHQVTYAGWPLYLYYRDKGAAFRAHGQSLHTHGGHWYLLRPDGSIIKERRFCPLRRPDSPAGRPYPLSY